MTLPRFGLNRFDAREVLPPVRAALGTRSSKGA
jgi:hypothetical protein